MTTYNTNITEFEKLGKLGKQKNIYTIVDSTMATPLGVRPIEYGVDMVIHSCTKYMGGHNDLIAGAAIGTRAGLYGAIAGAALGLFLGGSTSYVLLDEEGCIWYWYSENWDFIIIPVPPFIYYLPEYFRISAYTLWDGLDIGNP